MAVRHTAHAALSASSDEVDLEAWLFGLSDDRYRACARGHHGAGVFADDRGRGMVNVESIGGHLIVQHYRCVRARRDLVEMHSPASRVYLFHVVPVPAGVRWTLAVTPPDFACTVEVHLHPVLRVLAALSFLGPLLKRHVEEEAVGFAADIARKR